MSWFEEQLRYREQSYTADFEDAIDSIANAVMGTRLRDALSQNEIAGSAIEEILKYYHCETKRDELPPQIKTVDEQIEYRMRPFGIKSRSVTNLGGEGQMTIGIILALILGINAPSNIPKIIALPAMLILGALGGAIWGAVAGYLKNRFGVSELLSTVVLNYIATQLLNYCLRIPMLDPANIGGSGEPQTVKLPKGMWLSKMNELFPFLGKNTKFHSGLFIAVILAVLVYLLMWKTGAGYKMRAAGLSERAARYGGINVKKYALLSVILSGALCGLAGTIEVLGIHHRGLAGCTGGYGFSGIVVALFGGLHPIGVLPAAFFFAVISFGCSSLQLNGSPLPSNTIDVLQGLVILVIVATQMILKNRYIIDRTERFVNKHIFKKHEEAAKVC